MKKLLNTLFVTTQGAYLNKEGECVIISVERIVKLRLPIHTISGIICFGNVMASPPLMALCAENNVLISFLSENSRFFARVHGHHSGNVLLRRQHYRIADDEKASLKIVRNIITGKISNERAVLHRYARDHAPGSVEVEQAMKYLENSIARLDAASSVDSARGIEGDSARIYFSLFDNLIVSQKEDFKFEGRNKRPPLDNVNAMLSFVYTLLAHDVESALEAVGLDPCVGFLHCDRPGRPGLALDIMEELRPFFADRLVLSLINLQRVKAKGFRKTESGAVLMDDATRKEVLVAYQERKKEEIFHPFIEEKISFGMIPYVQALLLARCIRRDIESYPPFFWK